MDDFINTMTINNMRNLRNVQLWQFSISKGNSYNYKKEIERMEKGDVGLWSKPNCYEKYKDKTNLLLITDNKYTDVLMFEESKLRGRSWWDDSSSSLGTINVVIIGRLKYGKDNMATICDYKRFSIGNKFQPIKKVTYDRFIENLSTFENRTEDLYVKNVYNKIAEEFSDTRYRPWSCVEDFLGKVEPQKKIGDIGCGNGKNMLYRKDCDNYGCDFSENLVKICNNRGLNVKYGDVLNIPFSENSFDYTICIAVIHHLSTTEKRKKSIDELIRVTKKGGKILVLVWALEQPEESRRKFSKQENLVDWKDKKGNLLGERYYYVFKKDELESLIDQNVKIEKSFYELGNWGIILEKV
jgi:SAM-dependent methyltransferase